MATFSPATFYTLALLRFRAATAGDKAIKSFQSYSYDRDDPLEPFRFEALCRIRSIAEFSSSIPENVPQLDDREVFRITADLLDEWISTSAEITGEVYALDPGALSPTGQRMVDFLSHILKPHHSIFNCLPSKTFFEDCSTLLLPIREDVKRCWLEDSTLERSIMSEIYAPLNAFIFAPAIHFFHWLLYYWRRHATTTPALPFSKTVIEAYRPMYLRSFAGQSCDELKQHSKKDPKIDAFWKASKYPVRGVWGCSRVHRILQDLLEQNVRIAHKRLFNTGTFMTAQKPQIIPNPTPKRPPSVLSTTQANILARSIASQSHLSQKTQSTSLIAIQPKPTAENGKFTCPSCTSPNHFTMRKDLRRHIESIHYNTGFFCTISSCSRHAGGGHRPFNRWDNLARHMRRVHGK